MGAGVGEAAAEDVGTVVTEAAADGAAVGATDAARSANRRSKCAVCSARSLLNSSRKNLVEYQNRRL